MISVIIPMHNAERYIGRAITSVLAQTYKDFEVVIIDDGSTDNSLHFCELADEKYKQIHVFTQTHKGVGAARNYGIANSFGDLLFFLDADDYIRKDALKKLHDSHLESEADMVAGGTLRVSTKKAISPKTLSPFNKKVLDKNDIVYCMRDYLNTNDVYLASHCWGRLYRKDFIEQHCIKFNESMRIGEDGEFNINYLTYTKTLVVVDEPLYYFQMHDSASLSLNPINNESILYDFKKLKSRLSSFFHVNGGFTVRIDKDINALVANWTIAQLIRTSKVAPYKEVRELTRSHFIQQALACYAPMRGHSKLIPFLMKLRCTRLLIFFCKKKRRQVYGK